MLWTLGQRVGVGEVGGGRWRLLMGGSRKMGGDNVMVVTDRGRYDMLLNPTMVKDKCKKRQCYSFILVCAFLKDLQGKLVF